MAARVRWDKQRRPVKIARQSHSASRGHPEDGRFSRTVPSMPKSWRMDSHQVKDLQMLQLKNQSTLLSDEVAHPVRELFVGC